MCAPWTATASPWLNAQVGVYVFSGTPTILYPTPSTTITGSITPAYLSSGFLYNYTYSGTVYFDLGTTTAYGITDLAAITTAFPAYKVWDDWVGHTLLPRHNLPLARTLSNLRWGLDLWR